MNVSLICACKNRERALRVSLSSWLLCEEIKEIIIVDWSSDRPLNDLTKIDKRIKVIRVDDEKYFNQPQPLNLAASIATCEYIVKVDCDYVFNPYYNFFEMYPIDDNSFTCGQNSIEISEYWNEEIGGYCVDTSSMSMEQLSKYFHAYSPFFKFLTGLLYIKKENFLKVGGYNENMGKYYAFEDDEIVSRLEFLGLENRKLIGDHSLIHLPHPDKKRYENFESYYEDSSEKIEEIKNYLVKDDLSDNDRWNFEYLLAKRQVEQNRELFSEITNYYIERIYKWKIQQMDDQNYFASRDNKLKDLNRVFYVTLDECEDRQKKLDEAFGQSGITDINPIISKRFSECDDVVTGKYAHTLNDGTKGCCVSHLKAINEWYNSGNEEYGFFCEDDLSLETVDHWNFSWGEFVESLPEDWECVQLLCIRGEFEDIKLRDRLWDDWAATAYIMKRDYAKKIIDNYIIENKYHLELKNADIQPLIENILFTNIGKVYTIPLFVENVEFQSTFEGNDDDVKEGQKRNHYFTYETVLNWWKTNGPEKSVQEIMGREKTMTRSFQIQKTENKSIEVDPSKTELENLLTTFSVNTENDENNFQLALWYENNGHTAPALSYYLRCAERTEDNDLAYESLIRGSYCYEKQGTRDMTSKALLQQALVLLPNRPEAYFLLSRYSKRRQWWQDTYIYADTAIRICDFDSKPLRTNVEYPGKYGLLFEKQIAAWWWGKGDEARALLQEMKNNYQLNEEYYSMVQNNLMQMGSGHIPEEVIKYQKPKHDTLKFKFEGSENIEKNYSQAFQDMFILAATNGKRNGLYLEIGAQQPFYQNNTALLETQYGWDGISIEIVKYLCDQFYE